MRPSPSPRRAPPPLTPPCLTISSSPRAQEIDELVEEWQPEPLVSEPAAQALDVSFLASVPVVQGAVGPRVRLAGASDSGRSIINLMSYNFNGLLGHKALNDAAIAALRVYGLGSCSAAGFYTTFGQLLSRSSYTDSS